MHGEAIHPANIASHRQHTPVASSASRYDAMTRALHWIFAAGIVYASVVGYSLHWIEDEPTKEFMAHLNMSIATLLIALFPLRLGWRLTHTAPSRPQGLSPAQAALAQRMHQAMYLVIFCVLLSGYLMTPRGYTFFGLFTIPTPFDEGDLVHRFFLVHRVSCAILSGMVILHVLAVFAHRRLHGINLLGRML